MVVRLLLVMVFASCFTSCDMANKINQSTCEINRNTAAIDRSTESINRNIEQLEQIRAAR